MKVTRLEAEKVYSHFPIRVEFLPDLTFLTGLNGSGKTSALRLLMGLLTPSLDELASIPFESATVTVHENDSEVVLRAERTPDTLCLTTSKLHDKLVLSAAEVQLVMQAWSREEPRSPVHERVAQHVVFRSIAEMSTPMFLGIDRRQSFGATASDDTGVLRRRELELRRMMVGPGDLRRLVPASLLDVNYLVTSTLHEIRGTQEQLDSKLRSQILLGAFKYEPISFMSLGQKPSRAALESFRRRREAVERAAAGLKLPVEELQVALSQFFERMNQVVEALEKTQLTPQKKQRGGPKQKGGVEAVQPLAEWLINKAQTDRVFNHIKLLEEYDAQRAAIHEPISRFLSLVNSFLVQTKKRVEIGESGTLVVRLEGTEGALPVYALSSGERQLLVILAHLSLNKSLAGSGIFIVDEPELSLHISWQERFVNAICEANPSVQLIMATHSPAILMDRVNHERSLS